MYFPHSDNFNFIIRINNIEGDYIALTSIQRSQGPSSGDCAVLVQNEGQFVWRPTDCTQKHPVICVQGRFIELYL